MQVARGNIFDAYNLNVNNARGGSPLILYYIILKKARCAGNNFKKIPEKLLTIIKKYGIVYK